MIIIPWLILLLITIYAIYRYFWIDFFCERWQAACILYQLANFDTIQDNSLSALTEVWPKKYILTYFWVWEFSRFIVDQEGKEKVLEFFTKPEIRNNI